MHNTFRQHFDLGIAKRHKIQIQITDKIFQERIKEIKI